MPCMDCVGKGYWECGEGELCGGPAGGKWTVTGTAKLKIPGPSGGRVIVDVKARCEYDQKEDEYIPKLRLKVKGVESADKTVWQTVPVKLDEEAAMAKALEFYDVAQQASERIETDKWQRLTDALKAILEDLDDEEESD